MINGRKLKYVFDREEDGDLIEMPKQYNQIKLYEKVQKRVSNQMQLNTNFVRNEQGCQSQEQLAFQEKLWALLDPLAFLMEKHDKLG